MQRLGRAFDLTYGCGYITLLKRPGPKIMVPGTRIIVPGGAGGGTPLTPSTLSDALGDLSSGVGLPAAEVEQNPGLSETGSGWLGVTVATTTDTAAAATAAVFGCQVETDIQADNVTIIDIAYGLPLFNEAITHTILDAINRKGLFKEESMKRLTVLQRQIALELLDFIAQHQVPLINFIEGVLYVC